LNKYELHFFLNTLNQTVLASVLLLLTILPIAAYSYPPADWQNHISVSLPLAKSFPPAIPWGPASSIVPCGLFYETGIKSITIDDGGPTTIRNVVLYEDGGFKFAFPQYQGDIVTVQEYPCAAHGNPPSAADVLCNKPGVATVTVTDGSGLYTLTADITCTFAVIPESPIGAIAIMGSSLAALGGFVYFRRSRNKAEV